MLPLNLAESLGGWAPYAASMLVGIGFGAVLEQSGFGDSRKLAAQFYLKDLTVLKVMFTAIVVAAALMALFSALGLVDMQRVFVPPTFLVPGIVGGLVMGVGFIVGGFCPGTSVVSASTLKLDGILFALGVAVGIGVFGETVHLFEDFWYSSSLGRFVLPELLGLPTGGVVLAVVLMALGMFVAAEVAEAVIGRSEPMRLRTWLPRRGVRLAASGALVALAAATLVIGDPTPEERWERVSAEAGAALTGRDAFVDPREVAELAEDTSVYTRFIDVRSETDYNLFHLYGAVRRPVSELSDPAFLRELGGVPTNTVIFVVSNDETEATEGWKRLVAHGVPNVYIVEGGMNGWLKRFAPPPCLATPIPDWQSREDEELAFVFRLAVGDCCNTARPEPPGKKLPGDCFLAVNPGANAQSATRAAEARPEEFPHKVKLRKKAAVKGGCG